ncbi:hypothetical protein DM01DRAFT_1386100 [Hesseltinella vesiculosa]|uniref:Uncharacterized protein n=1 Tax=Hesseltinella vesiculosa TaxID=101127 RepID=A0A1X2G739_9FUNG|nr:hypothetical protein DM01DRAFT_1386100 [Hesseltinella vesiculosa]
MKTRSQIKRSISAASISELFSKKAKVEDLSDMESVRHDTTPPAAAGPSSSVSLTPDFASSPSSHDLQTPNGVFDTPEESDDQQDEDEDEDEDFESNSSTDDDAATPQDQSQDPDNGSNTESDDDIPIRTVAARRRASRPNRAGRRERRPQLSWNKKVAAQLCSQHPELETVWDDLRTKNTQEIVPIEQPDYITVSLLPFQRYGVAWMIHQEQNDDFKGGILADEMGMGKTLQTLTLLLSDSKKPNLVIAPAVAIIQWKNEIEKFTVNNVKINIFHGSNRTASRAELEGYDIVITTYSTMENMFRRQQSGVKRNDRMVKEKSLLHTIHWHRIILDEAHNIKDRSNNSARACFNLKGNFKWSLTGTPLQNRVGELYSLIRFMQADPFAYYYCKLCPCKCINWSFDNNRTCTECNHRPMDHVCWWNNEVLKPIQRDGYVGEGKEAMDKLRLLLDHTMLRRTKEQCADDLGLPPRTVVVRRDVFNADEEEVYTSLFRNTARQFNSYMEQGTVLNHYANIFELLTRMRQCADHPDLVTKRNSVNMQLVCGLCNEPPEDAIKSECRHVFCSGCAKQYVDSFEAMDEDDGSVLRCPTCFAKFTINLYQPPVELDVGHGEHKAFSKTSIVNRIDMTKWRSSTKIEALYEELSKLRSDSRSVKSIVFSQFVNFLDLVYWRLSRAGFNCVRLDGTMSPEQRDAAIQYFMTEPNATVFLISLKAGGVALNLTEASRVFICDPWWNPSAELQAMDRIHRLGQYRPVRITRMIIENSIESRIVKLQEKKMALVNSTIDRDQSAMDRLSVEDLRFLFSM